MESGKESIFVLVTSQRFVVPGLFSRTENEGPVPVLKVGYSVPHYKSRKLVFSLTACFLHYLYRYERDISK